MSTLKKLNDAAAKEEVIRVVNKAKKEGVKFSQFYFMSHRDKSTPSPSWMVKRHGSWTGALEAYGITEEDRQEPLKRSLAHLKSMAKNGTPTQKLYEETRPSGTLSFHAVAYHVGSWSKAVRDAVTQ